MADEKTEAKKSFSETLADILKKEDFKALSATGKFDELRIATWQAEIERANKEKNPTQKYAMLHKSWQGIEQVGCYYAGKEKYGDKVEAMGLDFEQKINTYVGFGKTLIDKLLE